MEYDYQKQLENTKKWIAECESLNKRAASLEEIADDLQQRNHHLTQECEELKERKLKLELNENHNKNEIKKLKKRIRKDREFFKNKISSLTLARKQFLEALDHFNWQITKVYDDILDIINKAKGEGNVTF